MSLDAFLAAFLDNAPTLLASLVAVLFMTGIAALLGFRQRARIDQAELARLAAAERLSIESAVISADATRALARLTGGKLLIVRVMGADVSARVAPAGAASIRRRDGGVVVAFADPGFPPLQMDLEELPTWLAEFGETR